MEQRSPEWFAARAGKVTASRVADIVAKTKTGYAASRANYMAQLICERMIGQAQEGFSSSAMQWGTDTEPLARSAYEMEKDVFVTEVGMINHPTIEMAGASPDGLVGDDGLVEIKCPNTATHIDNLLNNKAPANYVIQMQWQMACTGRQWCDFVSFDPRMPEDLQMMVVRVQRDEKQIATLEAEVIKFLDELQQKVDQLTALNQSNGVSNAS